MSRNTQLKELFTKLAEMEGVRCEFEDKEKELSQAIEQKDLEIGDLQARIGQITQDYTDINAKYVDSSETVETQATGLKEIEGANAELQNAVADLKTQLSASAEELSAAENHALS